MSHVINITFCTILLKLNCTVGSDEFCKLDIFKAVCTNRKHNFNLTPKLMKGFDLYGSYREISYVYPRNIIITKYSNYNYLKLLYCNYKMAYLQKRVLRETVWSIHNIRNIGHTCSLQ